MQFSVCRIDLELGSKQLVSLFVTILKIIFWYSGILIIFTQNGDGMKVKFLLTVFVGLFSFILLQAHDGHDQTLFEQSFMAWLGSFHPLFLHFPIALIVMTAVAECFSYWTRDSFFDAASRFMIMAAAVTAIPTTLFGLAFAYSATYGGELMDDLWWHRFFGLLTTFLVVGTVYMREYYRHWPLYYALLVLSFISVCATAFFGGQMTFGPFYFLPPFLFS